MWGVLLGAFYHNGDGEFVENTLVCNRLYTLAL